MKHLLLIILLAAIALFISARCEAQGCPVGPITYNDANGKSVTIPSGPLRRGASVYTYLRYEGATGSIIIDKYWKETYIFVDGGVYHTEELLHYLRRIIKKDTIVYKDSCTGYRLGRIVSQTLDPQNFTYTDATIVNQPQSINQWEWQAGSPPFALGAQKRDTLLTKLRMKQAYEHYRFRMVGGGPRATLYTALSITPALTTPMASVAITQYPDNSQLPTRQLGERAGWGYRLAIPIGITLSRSDQRNNQSLYAEPVFLWQGFETQGHTIDWATGRAVADGGNTSYHFGYLGLGLGYCLSGQDMSFGQYAHRVAEVSAYHLWQTDFGNVSSDTKGITPQIWGAHIAFGLAITPLYRWEVRVMPSMDFNFTAIQRGELKTRLFNTGLMIAVAHRYFSGRWKRGSGPIKQDPFKRD